MGQTSFAVQSVEFESPNLILRAMQASDAQLDWGRWFLNAEAAKHLNMAPRNLSVEERRAYIARFNSRDAYMIGIWRKSDNRFVGFWSIYVDLPKLEFYLNIIVGDEGDRDQGIRSESTDRLYQYFFNDLQMRAALCTVSDTNPRLLKLLKRLRWGHIGTTSKPSASGEGTVAIHKLRLSREAWLKRSEPGWTPAEV